MVTRIALAALAAAGLALACGSTDGGKHSPSGGSAGQPVGGASGSANTAGSGGGGGTSAGASGSGGGGAGGGLMLGSSETEACIEYAVAVCSRRDECDMRPVGDCLRASFGCPDLTFSPGTTRSIEGLKACAAAYKTLPCEEVRKDILPACVTPGTRQQGEACAYPSQCASLTCEASSACGKCAKGAALGEDCTADDVDCGSGLLCVDGKCIDWTSPTIVPGNAPCPAGTACAAGYECGGVEGLRICTPLPKLDQPCPTDRCDEGLYCTPEGTCKTLPGAAQPCGLEGSGDSARPWHCAEGLECHYTDSTRSSGTCEANPGVGQPCYSPPGDPESYRCASPLHCSEALVPAVCVEPVKAGGACTSAVDCDAGLSCSCPSTTPDCASRVCSKIVLTDERCDVVGVACHPGMDCVAGVCKPGGLRGEFADACMMP